VIVVLVSGSVADVAAYAETVLMANLLNALIQHQNFEGTQPTIA
jgi:hypothetical protein